MSSRTAARRHRRTAACWTAGALCVAALVGCAGSAAGPTAGRGSKAGYAQLLAYTVAQGHLPPEPGIPSAASPHFLELARALWQGILTGNPRPALAALFPQGAYEQLKAISNPGRDWSARLERDFELDVLAAHRLLGASAADSTLVGVDVRSYYAHRIAPNSCGNAIGYYEMPGARVVYETSGRISSFGIASMISWRKVWYIVHMGALHRRHPRGAVDHPRTGPGSPEYSGTC